MPRINQYWVKNQKGDFCKLPFGRSANLNMYTIHKRIHYVVTVKQVRCDICESTFNQSGA